MFSLETAAESNFYAGIGFSHINVNGAGGANDISPSSITLGTANAKIGAKVNKHLQGEIRVGTGIKDESVDAFGVEVDLEIEQYYGVYLKAGVPDLESFFPHFIVGYTDIELKGSSGGLSLGVSDSDFSYGVGIDFKLSELAAINAEFINLYDDESKWNAFTLGLIFNF